MRQRRGVVPGVQDPGQVIERLRVGPEKVQIKHCFWLWQVVFLKVTVQASPRSTKVRYPGRARNSSPAEPYNVFAHSTLYEFGNSRKIHRLKRTLGLVRGVLHVRAYRVRPATVARSTPHG